MNRPNAGVTVVIPVWDRYVAYLGDAVESVRRNSPDAQVVVVDNASSTPVPELSGCAIARTTRRLSVGAARNLGLDRVATEYVVFLDADDMLLDGTLEFLVGRISTAPELAIAATSILDGATGERHRTPRPFVSKLTRCPRAFAFANSIWSLLPIQGCAILRTAQVRESGGYADADLGEDWVLGAALAWRGRVTLSERLGRYYRSTEGSFAGRAWTGYELRANARRVRERLQRDAGVARWAKALLPVIALLQIAAIHLARPTFVAIRKLTGRRRQSPENVPGGR